MSCKMGPDYSRPETPAKDLWRMAPATTDTIANLAWWDLLKDQELQNLMKIAFAENQDVRTALASVEQYRAQLVMTKWDLAPSLGYSAHAFLFQTSGNAATIPTGGTPIVLPNLNGRSGNTTFSNESRLCECEWEIDVWGRLRRAVESSEAQLFAQEEGQRALFSQRQSARKLRRLPSQQRAELILFLDDLFFEFGQFRRRAGPLRLEPGALGGASSQLSSQALGAAVHPKCRRVVDRSAAQCDGARLSAGGQ